MHDADEDGAGRDRSAKIVGINASCAIDGHIGHTPPQALQKPTRFNNGWMLDRGRDDMIALVPECKEHALNGKIVGLAAATREDDLVSLTTKQRCYLLTSCI